MSKKRRNKQPILNLEVTDFASEGKCVSKTEEKVVFSSYTAPGDIIDLQPTKARKNYVEGKAIQFHKKSDMRIEPKCEHFGLCGGCKWQHIPYSEQTKFKEKQVIDNLVRIGHLDLPKTEPILGAANTFAYRNKMEFTFTNKRWLTDEEIKSDGDFDRRALGFHVPGGFDRVIPIEYCHLQDDVSNKIRNHISDYAKTHEMSFFDIRENHGDLRTLTIRCNSAGDLMLVVQFSGSFDDKKTALLEDLKNTFPQIASLNYVVNNKKNDTYLDQKVICFSGEPHIFETLGSLKFKISPKSFFQTNSEQANGLYEVTKEFCNLTGDDVIYDLYTGTGTIANYVADKAKKVIGVEYVEEAIADAKLNSEANNIDNTVFYAGDMKDIFTTNFVEKNGAPDLIITDPPRAGMHEDVVNTILALAPKRIVYVSCNAATQARDLALLSSKYNITRVRPVDMFPHTHHVENVVALELG